MIHIDRAISVAVVFVERGLMQLIVTADVDAKMNCLPGVCPYTTASNYRCKLNGKHGYGMEIMNLFYG